MGEKELVKRCQKGDKKAFEELVERFYPYVSGFLLKTTRNSILAEDLTQETFLKMIRNIENTVRKEPHSAPGSFPLPRTATPTICARTE